jgi:hypothetical protein
MVVSILFEVIGTKLDLEILVRPLLKVDEGF